MHVDQTGAWDVCEVTYTAHAGWADGNSTWRTVKTNFQGVTVQLSIAAWDTWREWYQLYTYKDYYVRVLVSDGNQSFIAALKVRGTTELFGAIETMHVYAYAHSSVEFSSVEGALMYPWLSNINIVNASITFEATRYCVFTVTDRSGNTYGNVFELNHNFNGKTVTVTLNYYHGGQGEFNIYHSIIWQATYPPNYLPPEEYSPYVESWWEDAWKNIQGFLKGIGDWFNYVYSGLAFFWNLVIVPIAANVPTLIQLLPIVVIFWLLDAVVTSVQTGDLHPLGNALMTIYNFLRALIQTIVNIAETVWNIIKFW